MLLPPLVFQPATSPPTLGPASKSVTSYSSDLKECTVIMNEMNRIESGYVHE